MGGGGGMAYMAQNLPDYPAIRITRIPRDHCFFSAFPEGSLNGKAVYSYIDAMNVYRRNGGIASIILNLGTRWR